MSRSRGRAAGYRLPHSHILKRRAPPSRTRGASPAARSSMKRQRQRGLFRVKREYLTQRVEGFPKPGEGKSKSLGRKFKANGSKFQVYFFHESGLFKDLRANLSESPLGGGRRRAWTCEDAPPQRLVTRIDRACFARAVPQSMTVSPPAALAAFLGTKSSYITDLENRKQKSHGTVRPSAITHG